MNATILVAECEKCLVRNWLTLLNSKDLTGFEKPVRSVKLKMLLSVMFFVCFSKINKC